MMSTARKSTWTLPIWIALVTSMALTVCSCGSGTNQPQPSKTSTPATTVRTPSPYPPVKTDWDVAGSLTGEAKNFAQFAAETQADEYQFRDANNLDTDLMSRYNERVVADYRMTKYQWQESHVGIPATGGQLVRAIDSAPSEGGQIITLCVFNTPGEFMVVNGKVEREPELDPNTRVLRASTMTVESTTEPSGAYSKHTNTPRLLAVSLGYINKQDAVSRCDKFAPEPFIQTTPSPTAPASPSK